MRNEKRFSIGKIAKLTGVTVRTLQYYDNIDLLPVDKEKTNGKRYYSEADLAKLQQILFYKTMGLQVKEIKKLFEDETNQEKVISILNKQRDILYHRMNEIKGNIAYIETSLDKLEEDQTLSLGNLIQLIISLNKDTIFEYETVEYDKNVQNVFMDHYENTEKILEVYWEWKGLVVEAVSHSLNDIDPASEQGQTFAKKWLKMVKNITKDSQELLDAHKNSYEKREQWPEEDQRLMDFANDFIDEAIHNYLNQNKGTNLEEDYD